MEIRPVAVAAPPVTPPVPGLISPPAPPPGVPAERAFVVPGTPQGDDPGTELQVHFDKDSRMYLVRLVDPQTKQVVVQVPPQQVLDLVSHLLELNEQKDGRV